MAAAEITSTGDFTGLATDLTPYEDVLHPPHTHLLVAPTDLQTVPDEIRQMVRVFQDGWGALLGAGKRLDFWVTVRLIELLLQAYKGEGVPRSGDRTV